MPKKTRTYKKVQRDAVMQGLIDRYGPAELVRMIAPDELTRQAVFSWPRVPERWVTKVAEVTGKSRHEIRPDLFAKNGQRVYGRQIEPRPLLPV